MSIGVRELLGLQRLTRSAKGYLIIFIRVILRLLGAIRVIRVIRVIAVQGHHR